MRSIATGGTGGDRSGTQRTELDRRIPRSSEPNPTNPDVLEDFRFFAVVKSWMDEDIIEATVRNREELLSVSMTVATANEIKLLYLEFQSAGVAFHQTLKKQPWGAKNFVVKDPDGNLLLFAGPAN